MKNSFLVYHDLKSVTDAMTDAQAGVLLKAMLAYSVDREIVVSDDPALAFVLISARSTLDRDASKYEIICEKKRMAGSSGGKQRAANQACASICKHDQANQADSVSVSDIDIESDLNTSPPPPKGGENAEKPKRERKAASSFPLADAFAEFWQSYPRKVAKPNAQKAWAKLSKANELPSLETLLSAIASQADANEWSRDGGKFCPHPATWLNGKRWEDSVTVADASDTSWHKYRLWAASYLSKRAAILNDTPEATPELIDAGARVLGEWIAPDGFSEAEAGELIVWILRSPERAAHVPDVSALGLEVPGWGQVISWASNGSRGLEVGDSPYLRSAANG